MSSRTDGPGPWLLLAGFVTFCVVVGLCFGFVAYDLVRVVFAG
ncbi:hypothetical protein [Cryptosporangium japonicum]|uniref:Uncharacterized protein n=1 Tax=Cryptosporangium japonicum TaxID=80872 RepID=A0ABN0U676_9ACTN